MPAVHHVALRVDDVDRSVAFYEAVFGARPRMRYLVDGEEAEMVVGGGPQGTAMIVQSLTLDGGGALELFEFTHPTSPTGPADPWGETLMHLAIEVDDTDASLALIEAAGGSRMWPRVLPLGTTRIVYARDPDGNVIELIDSPVETLIAQTEGEFDRLLPGGGDIS